MLKDLKQNAYDVFKKKGNFKKYSGTKIWEYVDSSYLMLLCASV